MLDPQQFVQRWSDSQLGERQAAQSHFIELCQLISHAPPSQYDQAGVEFCFEKPVSTVKGSKGFADVWYKDHFAWEYKGKHKDLDAAYDQLSAYRGGLDNPPLLVVCDFLEYRIYPQWPNMDGTPIVFHNDDLVDPLTLRYVRWLLEDPTAFLRMLRPDLAERNRITRNLAEKFAELAGLMRQNPDWQPMQIARFLTKIAFTLFVDDIRLLPIMGKGFRKTSVVESIIDAFVEDAGNDFPEMLQPLFEAMDGRTSRYIGQPVPYFNGGLFADSGPDTNDGVEVLDITQIIGAMDILRQVSEAEWQDVNPTIFGTLFEGALDDSKRAQLGAHYTDEPDIRLVVEPVLMQPLRQQWEAIQAEAAPLLQTYATATAAKPKEVARLKLVELHDRMMHLLENTRVLDPACGSGNFLYVSLLALKDLEAEVRRFFGRLGLPFRDVVTPRQLYGIEKDEFAAKLAHVVVWIGYLQWRYTYEGVLHPRLPRRPEHPMMLPHPILQDKLNPDEPDRIICADAIMRYDADGKPYEPEWPAVDVIMGNPPFLGGYKQRSELGGKFLDDLWQIYENRVPGSADLVCYWFEKARSHLATQNSKRAGLLATNSIRGGVNRAVLDRIQESGEIFMAWSDRDWVLEGAAVRISIVGFRGGKTPQPAPPEYQGWAHTYAKPETYDKIQPAVRELRKEPTLAEKILWEHIRKNEVGGYKFRRQHPIDRFIVDFYCTEARLAIELDGPIHDQQQGYDQARQEFLERLGVRVLRFKNDDVLENVQGAVEVIYETLQQKGVPSPNPSPTHWGGEQGQADDASLPFPVATGKGPGDGDAFMLDGLPVPFINSDLTAATDVTQAKRLAENADLGFIGPQKDGPLDIPNELAEAMLRATNASGHPNSDVLRPYLNGSDIVRRSRNYWIIDFGIMSQTEAAQYAAPFRYMEEKVKPIRATNNDRQRRDNWWRLGRSGEDYRLATANLSRQIFTPRVAKHRVFVWAAGNVFPDSAVAAIARQDDYFFGVLHSYLHEIWSLRLGTWLGKGNDPRYTPTSTFETYPFPVPPGKEDTTSAVYQAISAAAKQLNEERETWLNPPDLTGYGRNEKALRERTLTNLYNAVEEYRAVQGNGKNGHAKETPAHKFAPRLAELHDTLDQAVLAAYGWEDLVGRLRTPDGDEELLRRLLALNLQRAGA